MTDYAVKATTTLLLGGTEITHEIVEGQLR